MLITGWVKETWYKLPPGPPPPLHGCWQLVCVSMQYICLKHYTYLYTSHACDVVVFVLHSLFLPNPTFLPQEGLVQCFKWQYLFYWQPWLAVLPHTHMHHAHSTNTMHAHMHIHRRYRRDSLLRIDTKRGGTNLHNWISCLLRYPARKPVHLCPPFWYIHRHTPPSTFYTPFSLLSTPPSPSHSPLPSLPFLNTLHYASLICPQLSWLSLACAPRQKQCGASRWAAWLAQLGLTRVCMCVHTARPHSCVYVCTYS